MGRPTRGTAETSRVIPVSLRVEAPFNAPQGLTPCMPHAVIQVVAQYIIFAQSLTPERKTPWTDMYHPTFFIVERVMHVNRMVDDLFRISWELSIIVMLGVVDLGKPHGQPIHHFGKRKGNSSL